jgi:hypothetical protein
MKHVFRASKSCIRVPEGNCVKTIVLTFAFVGLSLSGCSSPHYYWYNPDKYLSKARQDCRECYNEAVQQSSEDLANEYYSRSPEMRQTPFYSTRSERWSGSEFDALYESTLRRSNNRENLFRGCMKSRGYRLIREDELGQRIRKSSLRTGKVAGK